MQRTHLTVLVATLVVVGFVGGASAAPIATSGVDPDTGLGPQALETGNVFGGLPDGVATFGGQPGWHVAVDDRAALEDWAASADSREILSYDNDSNTSVIRASPSDIGTGVINRLLGNGLHARSYVQSIAVVQNVDTPEPPQPISREQFEPPSTGILGGIASGVPFIGGPSYATAGIAFSEDANRSTIGDAREAINATGTPNGSGVRVAVLDNTWTYDQSLYGDRVGAAYDFVDDEAAVANNSYQNVSHTGNHGDWTMSAIGANASNDSYDGVAPGATMYFGRVLGPNGGTTADIVDGLQWACEEQNVDVVSLSLGSAVYSPALDGAVQDCADQGTVVVIAAGNSAQTQPVGLASPADSIGEDPQSDGIITVAATNTSNASTAGVAHFSQRGPDPGAASEDITATRGAEPTIGAPGMKLTVRTAGGDVTLSGTSMATPIVAGAAAVIRDTYPQTSNNTRIEQRIGHGAAPMPNAGTHEVGAGMLNVQGALNTEPDTSTSYYQDQKDARTTAAQARDEVYQALSGDAGGFWDGLAQRVGA